MAMNFDKCRERYENDADFYYMVTMFYGIIFENRFTVSELRDALTFAGLKFEMENVRGIRGNIIKKEE